MSNDFHVDLAYSLEKQDDTMLDSFYRRIFLGLNRIEFMSDLDVQRTGVDKRLHFQSGKVVTIDEKKRRNDYGDILLELWSVLEQNKRGWLYKCQCDYIVYAVMPSHKVYLLPSLLLKRAWLDHEIEWGLLYPVKDAKNTGYTTRNIAIPTEILLQAISAEMQQELT